MSLASFSTLCVTAIELPRGSEDLRDIAHVQWVDAYGGSETSSVQDFVLWLVRGQGRGYVQASDGSRGPGVHVAIDGTRRYLRSSENDETADALLALPRIGHPSDGHRVSKHRSGGHRTWSRR
jgi:hypothetical protein